MRPSASKHNKEDEVFVLTNVKIHEGEVQRFITVPVQVKITAMRFVYDAARKGWFYTCEGTDINDSTFTLRRPESEVFGTYYDAVRYSREKLAA